MNQKSQSRCSDSLYPRYTIPHKRRTSMNHANALNATLDNYFDYSNKPECLSLLAKELTIASQNPWFLDQALDILLNFDNMDDSKLTLLTCLVKDKFQYCFELVEQDKIQLYAQQLMDIGRKRISSCRAVFENICKSLAILYLNCRDKVPEIFNVIDNYRNGNTEMLHFYFKITEFCAQSLQNQRVVLSRSKRKQAEGKMVDYQANVLSAISGAAQAVWSNQYFDKRIIMECFKAWINLKEDHIILNCLDQLPLFSLMIHLLRDNQYCQVASNCLIDIIENINYPSQCHSLYILLLELTTKTLIPQSQYLQEQKYLPMAFDYIYLALAFCIKFVKELVLNYRQQLKQQLMFPLIRILGVSDSEGKLQDQALYFCGQLFYELVRMKKDGYQMDYYLRTEVPVAWLLSIRQLIKYSPAIIQRYQTLPQKKFSQINQYTIIKQLRTTALYALNNIRKLIGPQHYLQALFSNIIQLQSGFPLSISFVIELESYLFISSPAIARLPRIQDKVMMMREKYECIVANSNQQTDQIPLLLHKSFLTMFRSILEIPQKNMEVVMLIMNRITQAMNIPLLAKDARQVFQLGCRHNASILHSRIQEILRFVLSQPPTTSLSLGLLRVALVDKAGAVDYIGPLIMKLHSNCQSSIFRKDSFSCLCVIMSQLQKEKDIQRLDLLLRNYMQSALNLLLKIIGQPSQNGEDKNDEVEKIVKLLKHIMRILKAQFEEFLLPLFQTVHASFLSNPICSLIYLVEVAITVFCPLENGLNIIVPIYQNFTSNALNHYQRHPVDSYIYLTEDLLGMNQRIITYYADIVTNSSMFPMLFQFVRKECLNSKQQQILKAADRFYQSLFKIYWEGNHRIVEDEVLPTLTNEITKHNLKVEILRHSSYLLSHFLQQLANIELKSHQQALLDTIIAQIKAFPQENVSIWVPQLQKVPSDILLIQDKQHILKLLNQVQENSRNGTDTTDDESELEGYLKLMIKRYDLSCKRKGTVQSFMENNSHQ